MKCLDLGHKLFLGLFPGEQNITWQRWALLSLVLHSVRIHSPLLPGKQERCVQKCVPRNGLSNGEAEVCLQLFPWETDPYVFVWIIPLESVRWTSSAGERLLMICKTSFISEVELSTEQGLERAPVCYGRKRQRVSDPTVVTCIILGTPFTPVLVK